MERVDDLWQHCQTSCAGTKVELADFATALSALDPELEEISEEGALEVFVALGCSAGDKRALMFLERRWLSALPRLLGHMKLEPADLDLVAQRVRSKLLGDSRLAPAPLLQHAGRGKLFGLLKVMSVREAISLLRKARARGGQEAEELDEAALLEREPELEFVKQAYRQAFLEAFAEATKSLSPRERNLLRLHYLGRSTLDALAQVYGVHRATIVRQLAAARQLLQERTHAELGKRLGARSDEVASIMGLLASRFDVSVEALLRSSEG